MKKNEHSLREFWDTVKHINTCLMEVPETEERMKGPEKLFEEIVTKNLTSLKKHMKVHI